ncbi:MAG TPA: zinc-ribbon domain-containing protein [Sphingomicrobium sp.]|nr:zinc-ribbon domain-containing protein [Sphingomicrobium sp.]
MILTCPSCGTQYVVKDGAVPPGGRQVRCASCKHSWHQDPDPAEVDDSEVAAAAPIAAEPSPDPEIADDQDESFAEAAIIEPRSGPEAEERAFDEAIIGNEADAAPEPTPEEALAPDEPVHPAAAPQDDWREPPQAEAQDDDFSPFPATDELEPRRRSPLLGPLLILLVVVALAAAFWFLAPPEWRAQLGLGAAGASPLQLVTTHMDRQPLESGNELLTVTGRVINPSGKEQDVPPIQAALKDRSGKVVYRWTIQPPARTLAPGGSASFNSAEVNVPPGGDALTISLGSAGA